MSDDVLERVRMCVAEAGYDPMLVRKRERPGWSEPMLTIPTTFPYEVLWRASELAGHAHPVCWACAEPMIDRGVEFGCRAVRRLELDCGVSRV